MKSIRDQRNIKADDYILRNLSVDLKLINKNAVFIFSPKQRQNTQLNPWRWYSKCSNFRCLTHFLANLNSAQCFFHWTLKAWFNATHFMSRLATCSADLRADVLQILDEFTFETWFNSQPLIRVARHFDGFALAVYGNSHSWSAHSFASWARFRSIPCCCTNMLKQWPWMVMCNYSVWLIHEI